MKISNRILLSMAAGITVAVITTACHKNDVNSATYEKETKKEKKEREKNRYPDNCPACGMG